ncbi:MAG: hypothetical protein ACI856_000213 [Kiritimatiellia bacterium]|jgi:hypothetical protein
MMCREIVAEPVGPFLERGACDEWGNGPAGTVLGHFPARASFEKRPYL